MFTLHLENNNLQIFIANFDQILLWAGILFFLATAITGSYLWSFSKNFYYNEVANKNERLQKKFSIFEIQLPFRKSYFEKILQNLPSKTNQILIKSLKADYFFMPFAYGMLLFFLWYFLARSNNWDLLGIKYFLNKTLSLTWFFPLVTYLLDIIENQFIKKLLIRMEVFKKEKAIGKAETEEKEAAIKKNIGIFRYRILIVASFKWLLVFVCIILIVSCLFVQLFF